MSFLEDMSQAIERRREAICTWYHHHLERARPPIYCSVDIRVSPHKAAVVDTNLYPAGFNNLYPRDLLAASAYASAFLQKRVPGVSKILVLPEDHSRNKPYFENLCALVRLFAHAGLAVRIGTLNPELRKEFVDLEVEGCGGSLRIWRAQREGNRLKIPDFDPDLILVNNDFSVEPPAELVGLSQPMEPPVEAGWHLRRKSRHFEILHRLIEEFCEVVDFDPWLLRAETQILRDVDIQELGSREKLAQAAREVLEKIRGEYTKRGIADDPYLFVKDNAGTYGIAVTSLKDPQEILTLNSKARKKLSAGKGGTSVTEFLVQEGVPTKVLMGNCPAEPVIYLIGGDVAGGFFRVHCEQNEQESLNVKGSIFSLLTFASPLDTDVPHDVMKDDTLLRVCGNMGKIASLALGYEIQELRK